MTKSLRSSLFRRLLNPPPVISLFFSAKYVAVGDWFPSTAFSSLSCESNGISNFKIGVITIIPNTSSISLKI